MESEVTWPNWVQSIEQSIAIHPQFVISGNIRDQFLAPVGGSFMIDRVIPVLWEMLSKIGYECLIVYDPTKGIGVFPQGDDEVRKVAARVFGGADQIVGKQVSLQRLAEILEQVAQTTDVATAFVVDYASRITSSPSMLSETEKEFFVACERLAYSTPALPSDSRNDAPCYNPIIWLVEQENDLPGWFSIGNEAIRSFVIGPPSWQQRRQAARALIKIFPNVSSASKVQLEKSSEKFANLSDGLTLQNMMSIAQLARSQAISLEHMEDAIRAYKIGVSENPWKQDYLFEKIRSGYKGLSKRVKGQDQGLKKALDILVRSVVGLSGAQASSSGNKPKGVLFLAGPTGVGKTELAKAITKLVFGDDQAYIRFDMSEFSAEHSEARLLGAPPGYVGHDAGGELVNAIRQRPFSLVLFDEIEKAHPRILDKFLQILEDGRITDGRGSTVYFSEAIIVFTSNLGVFSTDDNGERVQNISMQDTAEVIEKKLIAAIREYFQFELQRPEILNRIGENIIVFDYIRPKVARQILDKMLLNVSEKVLAEHGVQVSLSDRAIEGIFSEVKKELHNGGRGIGNKLEAMLINPLSWYLFDNMSAKAQISILEITQDDGFFQLVIE